MTHCKCVEIQETCPHVQEYWGLHLIWSNLTAAGLNEWKVLIGGFAEIDTLVKCNKTVSLEVVCRCCFDLLRR